VSGRGGVFQDGVFVLGFKDDSTQPVVVDLLGLLGRWRKSDEKPTGSYGQPFLAPKSQTLPRLLLKYVLRARVSGMRFRTLPKGMGSRLDGVIDASRLLLSGIQRTLFVTKAL
jgi:hypothetical protein